MTEKRLFIEGLTADRAYQSKTQTMRSELPAELRHGMVARHRSREAYKNIRCSENSQGLGLLATAHL